MIERLRPYLWSIALHAVLLLLIVVLGAQSWHREAPQPATLAIEAVSIDGKEFAELSRKRRKTPPPVVSEPEAAVASPTTETSEKTPDETMPERSATEVAPAEQAELRREVERKQQADRQRAAELKREAQLEREAELKREAEVKRQVEARKRVEAERLAAELAAEDRRQKEDARIRAEREQALQRALADELAETEATEARRVAALRAATLSAQWAAAIQARVQRAWIRPSSARAGLDCRVAVTQAPGGTVLRAEVKECNGDEAVRQSLAAAVFRASPLPPPPEADLFERNIELRFRPND